MDELSVKRAQKYLRAGLMAVSEADFKEALEYFKASAKNHPTADALTYWGWMEHYRGNTELAINLCQEAIEIDPDFGNPYNDIGSYLIALGDLEAAIGWLHKAVRAKRYDVRHFPHLNLGQIFLSQNRLEEALEQFRQALEHSPQNPDIEKTIREILESLQKCKSP